ncbi:MAG: F0F1 ATP synthase subunit B [Elusimicrobiota bacterium]
MEKLLQPDTGLMIWTIVTFGLLLLALTKFAWKPILDAINQREGKLKGDLDRAEKAQNEAELLRQKYETQLSEAQKTIQSMVTQAKADGEKVRIDLLHQAKEESEKLVERGRKELAGETDKLKTELRKEVAELSVSIAEKILKRSVDKKLQEDVLSESLKSLSGVQK